MNHGAQPTLLRASITQLGNVYYDMSNNISIVSSPFFSNLFIREITHGKAYSYKTNTQSYGEQNGYITNLFVRFFCFPQHTPFQYYILQELVLSSSIRDR